STGGPGGNGSTGSASSGSAGPSSGGGSSAPGTGTSGSASSPTDSATTAVVPQALRGSGERRQPGDPATAREALSAFGIDFFREAIVAGSGPNTVISPYSLFTVLAMARAGAEGDTAAQIDAV